MTPEHYQKLAEANLTVEQIGVVMQILAESEAAMKAAEEARKSVARERVQRWRDNKKAGVTLPKRNGDATVRLTRAEDSSSKEDISGKKKEDAPAAPTPRAELEKVLDSEHAAAVVEHRQRLKKPLTAYAAKKLAASLSKAPDANAAADQMIARGWSGFEPHWGKDRPNSTAPPPQPRNAGERALLKLQAGQNNEPPDTAFERVETGIGRRQVESVGHAWDTPGPQGAFGRS